jgi:secreted PhoX family phosphatase
MKYCLGFILVIALLPACTKMGNKNHPIIIDSVSKTAIYGGDTVTVYGKNLPANIGSYTVTLNGKPFKLLSAGADSVVVVVPKMAGSGPIVVVVNKDTITGPSINYNYLVTVSTIAGNGATGSGGGAALSSSFNCPWGITADANGDLYIADDYNRLIRKYTAATQSVSQINIPDTVQFYSPYNIALDRVTHNLYLTDFNLHVLKVHSDNTCTTIYNDSMPTAGIAVGPDGYLYVANNTYGMVIRMDTSGGSRTLFGSNMVTPRNLFFDKAGNLYVSAYGIFEITPKGAQSQLFYDKAFQGWEIARDTLGNIYEADHFGNLLRMIEASSGKVFTIAGTGNPQDADGVGLDASFNGPQGLCIDDNGVLYMTTYNYNTGGGNLVRKITVQ